MKFETEYDVGETVYMIDGQGPAEITKITVDMYDDGGDVFYITYKLDFGNYEMEEVEEESITLEKPKQENEEMPTKEPENCDESKGNRMESKADELISALQMISTICKGNPGCKTCPFEEGDGRGCCALSEIPRRFDINLNLNEIRNKLEKYLEDNPEYI